MFFTDFRCFLLASQALLEATIGPATIYNDFFQQETKRLDVFPCVPHWIEQSSTLFFQRDIVSISRQTAPLIWQWHMNESKMRSGLNMELGAVFGTSWQALPAAAWHVTMRLIAAKIRASPGLTPQSPLCASLCRLNVCSPSVAIPSSALDLVTMPFFAPYFPGYDVTKNLKLKQISV